MKISSKALITCLLVVCLVIAQGNSGQTRLGNTRNVSFPSYVILDENAQPLVGSSGNVGFISSVTGGSVISFSMTTGRLLSSVVVGETAGPISLVETGGKRLIAVPAVNSPSTGHPATISIIDATNAQQLELSSLMVLPEGEQITPATRALLTRDGKYCLIASSFDEPALISFNTETGHLVSKLALLERPSELVLYDRSGRRSIAIISAVANSLSVISISKRGELSLASLFSPADARFDEANNPAFSADGRSVYVASLAGNRLFGVDSRSGAQFASLFIPSPLRVAITHQEGGAELIGVTRIRRPVNGKPGGVTMAVSRGGYLALKSEFTPPLGVEFARANNVGFTPDASTAFVASDTGILFAFSPENGELQAHQVLGKGLRRLALSASPDSVAVVRSAPAGDEIVVVSFDTVKAEDTSPSDPEITRLKPDNVEQGRLKSIGLLVFGENFGDGASVIVNGNLELPGESARNGTALGAKLRRSLFDQAGEISVQVKTANGVLSQPAILRVTRPSDPVVESIRPDEVAGPASQFTLKVIGRNFRASSSISVGGQRINTERISDTELRAQVSSELVKTIGKLAVKVEDLVVPDLSSDTKELTIFGPRIHELEPFVDTVVAGAGSFKLKISGENFRAGATVFIRNKQIAASRVHRVSVKSIKVVVPRTVSNEAGTLAIMVRNPDGSESEPKELEAVPPQITSFEPSQLPAGIQNAKFDVLGSNFRKGLSVFVGRSENDEPVRIHRTRVRFRTGSRIVVDLGGELKGLIAQPGTLKFQVVNPNSTEGVPSSTSELKVVGPEIASATIKPVEGDGKYVKMVITGANFRRGAALEFFRDDDVFVRERVPDSVRGNRVTWLFRSNKVDGLRNLELRVVNPGEVKSNAVMPTIESESASH